mmetsp:Transcript_15608/g.26371  ORF Transcript_15608/g.26371 Transcript_15608/m.26371 type:complete len:179 (+) Transcript_15608:66-602(+)
MEASSEPGLEGFTSIKLQRLDMVCETALRNGQYCLIFDKTNNAEIYFNYKATLKELNKELVGVQMQRKTPHEVCESLRSTLVYAMRCGDRYVIYLDKMRGDFKNQLNFPPNHWPSEEIFDFKTWRENDCYMKVVKEEENEDLLKQKGRYFMNDNFQMIILASYHSDEDCEELVKLIPH